MNLPRDAAGGASELEAFARFCANLTLEKGGALRLEDFQRRMLADYFSGALETVILLSKKNGKTTLLAALALYHLLTTEDAECVVAASSRDQATILYDQAAGFVRRSEGLQRRLLVKRGYREIRSRRPGDAGRARVLAADVDTADGVIPTLALVDELHRAKSAGLYGIFRDGLGPRSGQMLTISVAGDNEQGPLGLMRYSAHRLPLVEHEGRYTYARSNDGAFAMHEWALRPDDDVDDMHVVKTVNPASWQTLEALRRRHDSPSMQPWQWARMACGIWVGAEEWWLEGESWRANETERTLEPGDRITLGFDGARTGDATALVACRLADGLLEPLAVWEPPGDGRPWEVPGGAVDAAVGEAMERFRVVRAYFDPPLWQTEIDRWAREFGEVVMRYPTNRRRFMDAVERFRTDADAGRLPHTGDETLTRHVLNARASEARGGYWLAKPSAAEKIDAAVAAVLAYEARADALSAPTADRSAYAFL
jgi:phage terminase large subunit-like protein